MGSEMCIRDRTYLAVAPEHPIANRAAQENSEVANFIRECQSNSTAEADFSTMEKKGIASGLFATHPLTEEKLPIWIANFVLMDYGSGAVMAVPGHDQRDWEFARKYQLEVRQVIESADDDDVDLEKQAFISPGRLMDSGRFRGSPRQRLLRKSSPSLLRLEAVVSKLISVCGIGVSLDNDIGVAPYR